MADDTKIDDGVSEDVTMTAETVTEDVSESVTKQIVDPVAEETAQPEVVQDGETAKATETENQENKSTSNSTEGELGLHENQRNIDNDKSQQESSNEQISKDETSDEKETAGKGGEKLSDVQNDDGDKNRPTDGEDADVEDNEDEEDANAKNAPAGNAPADDVSKKNDKDSRKKERVSTGKSVQSSINVKIVRIRDLGEEGEDAKSEAKSYSSRRSERSTFMTTVADEVSVAPTFDEVQAELDRVLSRQTAEDGLQQSELPGRTATRNTPATPMTDYPESPTRAGTKLTLASIPSATKDTIYQRALALMDTRCSSHTRSIGEGTVTTDRLPLLPPASLPDHPYRHFPESFFYVTQQRPLPAAPVKAWRGYHGNVYFEPLTCRKIDTAPVHKDKSFYTSLVLKNRGTRSVTFSPRRKSCPGTITRGQLPNGQELGRWRCWTRRR
ncbi:transcription elongation factor B polypeptide 3-like isoform X2 [Ptychodera flava]|uniref:transcription elongation factor B polypeptide 3-like isoform X2 n=1 Tax=Ptychodera flava TaxID=63121 RepID=UPI00396A7D0D